MFTQLLDLAHPGLPWPVRIRTAGQSFRVPDEEFAQALESDHQNLIQIADRGLYNPPPEVPGLQTAADRLQIRCVVDGGAYIGLSAIWWPQLFPESEILAIEPDASNYELLFHNTQPLGLRVTCVRGALSKTFRKGFVVRQDASGQTLAPWAYRFSYSDVGSLLGDQDRHLPRAGESGTIQGAPLEYYLNGWHNTHCPQVDLLKLDIEGQEYELLLDPQRELWLDRVRYLVLELHAPESRQQEILESLRADWQWVFSSESCWCWRKAGGA